MATPDDPRDAESETPAVDDEQEDRIAILARRALFVASALAGIGAAVGCGDDLRPEPCLTVAPLEPTPPTASTGTTSPTTDTPAPQPCLTAIPLDPSSPPAPCLTVSPPGTSPPPADAGAPRRPPPDAGPPPQPHPCLTPRRP